VKELAALARQGQVLLSGLEGRDLDEASVLPGLTVGHLTWHLVHATGLLPELAAIPTRRRPVRVEAWAATFTHVAADLLAQALSHHGDPRPVLAEVLARAAEVSGPDRTVGGDAEAIRLVDLAATRVIELTVHGLDLGIDPDREALAVSTRALARMLADRHPGRAVELRVPPFVAVQLIEGTVHRRGTPPAVVEMSPVTWLRLATGREAWAHAAITASGERSDLSALLPVLS
jgi:hypothetical protein